MAFIVRTFTKIRNNWKKSVFFSGVAAYGCNYGYETYQINALMREYCEEAVKYGNTKEPLSVTENKILVLLNPTSNKKDGMEKFQEYCEPILHLAGLTVDIVKTESEGHARKYVEELSKLPSAILVAGGDGTLSEAITGLMRRTENSVCPIGVLPIGRTNSVGRTLFIDSNQRKVGKVEEVKGLINSAISVVRGKTEKRDVMKIEVLPNSGDVPGKPVYAVGSIQWGAFRDAFVLRDKYWYTGPLREYFAFLFNSFSSKLTWKCDASLLYTPPCDGCSNCYTKPDITPIQVHQNTRWWAKFIPKSKPRSFAPNEIDYSKIVNINCTKEFELDVAPIELLIRTPNLNRNDTEAKLEIKLLNNVNKGFGFISNSWSRLNANKINDVESTEHFTARTVELLPKQVHGEGNEIFYSIDNEAYEVKPIRISLLPRAIHMYAL